MTDKVRENKLRRMALRQGLVLQKSRRRDPNALDFGCYGLVDAETNTAVMGFEGWGLAASLDEVEGWLLKPDRPTRLGKMRAEIDAMPSGPTRTVAKAIAKNIADSIDVQRKYSALQAKFGEK